MPRGGYVKAWRSMHEHPILRGDIGCNMTFRFYYEAAVHNARDWRVGSETICLRPGQWFGPLARVEAVTGLTKKQVRRAEEILARERMLTVEPVANRGRLVTVLNYDTYQGTLEVRADRGYDQGQTGGTPKRQTGGQTVNVQETPKQQRIPVDEESNRADRRAGSRADRLPESGQTEGTPNTRRSKEEEEGKKTTTARAREERGFEEFWSAYPKKRGKRDAKKAWRQTSKERPSTEDVVAKVKAFSKTHEWTKERGQFIPYPATWLRAGRWDDEVGSPASRDRERAQVAPDEGDIPW